MYPVTECIIGLGLTIGKIKWSHNMTGLAIRKITQIKFQCI